MRLALLVAVATLLLAAAAQAHPSYRWCTAHRCTRPRPAYRIRCGGQLWLSPRPAHVPAAFQGARGWWWCDTNIPGFS